MKLRNLLALAAFLICAVFVIVGLLAVLCCVFAPQLDAFDRGDGPLWCYAGVVAALVGGLATSARRWR